VQTVPHLSELRPKRVIGTANLYLGGRRHHFSREVQEAAIAAACSQKPDLTLITGDLTAQGLDAEFSEARRLIAPLSEGSDLFVIPGNHDIYVEETVPGARMRAHLGEWMPPTTPGLARFGGASALHLETCHPTWLSDGATDPAQLDDARPLLAEAEGFLFLCLHYPLRDRRGQPYGPARRANRNASDIEQWLLGQDRVDAILHGHEHHGFRAEIETGSGSVPILNPGASGYAWLPSRGRTAHFCIYTVSDRQLVSVERFAWNGSEFLPEAGGPYATGG